jgi:predicted lactoylglutathione lyase
MNVARLAAGDDYKEPKDHGFMYEHGFQDLDGTSGSCFTWTQRRLSEETR